MAHVLPQRSVGGLWQTSPPLSKPLSTRLTWGKPKDDDPDSSGKRYSDMSPEERQREVSRLIALAREEIDAAGGGR